MSLLAIMPDARLCGDLKPNFNAFYGYIHGTLDNIEKFTYQGHVLDNLKIHQLHSYLLDHLGFKILQVYNVFGFYNNGIFTSSQGNILIMYFKVLDFCTVSYAKLENLTPMHTAS